MFIRKKRNHSGTVTVVVVSKAHGTFKEIRNFDTTRTEAEADLPCQEAAKWMRTYEACENLILMIAGNVKLKRRS